MVRLGTTMSRLAIAAPPRASEMTAPAPPIRKEKKHIFLLLGGLNGTDGWVTSSGMLELQSSLAALPDVEVTTYDWLFYKKAADDIALLPKDDLVIVIGYSGGGSRATWLANLPSKPKIDLMVLYDPSPTWQMKAIHANVKRALCYHNITPFFFGLGGGALVGDAPIETVDIFEHHLLVQTDTTLHQQTIAEVRNIQIQVGHLAGEREQTEFVDLSGDQPSGLSTETPALSYSRSDQAPSLSLPDQNLSSSARIPDSKERDPLQIRGRTIPETDREVTAEVLDRPKLSSLSASGGWKPAPAPLGPPASHSTVAQQHTTSTGLRAEDLQTRTKLTPARGPRPTTTEGWALREVTDGTAILEGPNGVWSAKRGDVVPGLGRIDAIVRWGSSWIVATGRGVISTP